MSLTADAVPQYTEDQPTNMRIKHVVDYDEVLWDPEVDIVMEELSRPVAARVKG